MYTCRHRQTNECIFSYPVCYFCGLRRACLMIQYRLAGDGVWIGGSIFALPFSKLIFLPRGHSIPFFFFPSKLETSISRIPVPTPLSPSFTQCLQSAEDYDINIPYRIKLILQYTLRPRKENASELSSSVGRTMWNLPKLLRGLRLLQQGSEASERPSVGKTNDKG